MGKIITITSGKGGVGKSTTTTNLATALSERGKKVIALDFDIGLRNLDMLLGLENRIVYDIIDVMEGNCNIHQAIIKDKKTQNLYFIPASQTKDKNVLEKDKIKDILAQLKEDFDYVLIDSPAGIESGFEHSVFMSDKAIVVTTPEISAVRDADRVIGLMGDNFDIKEKCLIINRYKPKLVESGNMLNIDDVLDILGLPLVGILPDDEDIVSSTNLGEPIIHNKKSIFNKLYFNIVDRIDGKEIPFEDLNNYKKSSIFSKIRGIFK